MLKILSLCDPLWFGWGVALGYLRLLKPHPTRRISTSVIHVKNKFPLGGSDCREHRLKFFVGLVSELRWGTQGTHAIAREVTRIIGWDFSPRFFPRQVWQFVPDDGLPPWRDPGPGEPGWEPILNYCEVKPDEGEAAEVRSIYHRPKN